VGVLLLTAMVSDLATLPALEVYTYTSRDGQQGISVSPDDGNGEVSQNVVFPE
jgi:hypothetical protein